MLARPQVVRRHVYCRELHVAQGGLKTPDWITTEQIPEKLQWQLLKVVVVRRCVFRHHVVSLT